MTLYTSFINFSSQAKAYSSSQYSGKYYHLFCEGLTLKVLMVLLEKHSALRLLAPCCPTEGRRDVRLLVQF